MADVPARLFLCARCREQVLLCSHCDRGQRYCGQACSHAARLANQREAGQRYQRGADGRLKHAERQRRWRQRWRDQRAACCVTHHGSPQPASDAPLQACPAIAVDPHPPAPLGDAHDDAHDDAHELGRCRRCAAVLPPRVRQGFLRQRRAAVGAHLAGWPPQPRARSP